MIRTYHVSCCMNLTSVPATLTHTLDTTYIHDSILPRISRKSNDEVGFFNEIMASTRK